VRVYSGGYHAKTPQGCFVLSTFMLVSVMLLSRFLYLSAAVYIISLFTSAIIIAFLSPTETANRPLDKTEKRVYKKRTLIILLFTVSTTAALIALGCANSFTVSLVLGLCCVSLMLVAGRIQNLYSKPTDII
jgi:accessory gene regulator B